MDFSELFGNVEDTAQQAWSDVINTGVPALQSSLEQWGIDVLTQQHAQTQQTVDTNVKELLSRPDSTGFGSYISNTLKSPVMQQYGGWMVAGVVVVGIAALVIFRRS